jgi:uncharacterized protein (TIGR02271 family)
MSGILNKLGLGHSSASDSSASSSSASSSSSSSTTSHSSSSYGSSTAPATTSTTTGYNTVNKTGYADTTATTSAYAHTNPGAIAAQTTTTTTTTTAAAVPAATNEAYMTRSEERLLVGKEQVGAGVASLNKYVTSEHVHTSVPITREHVVIEREPITAADAVRGAEIKEAHIEVALTEERAVAAKETVAVEKVKLRKEVEHTTQNVDAELRKEHIEFGTTNETTHGKVLGAAPGTTAYDKTYSTTTGTNVDPVSNPRV